MTIILFKPKPAQLAPRYCEQQRRETTELLRAYVARKEAADRLSELDLEPGQADRIREVT